MIRLCLLRVSTERKFHGIFVPTNKSSTNFVLMGAKIPHRPILFATGSECSSCHPKNEPAGSPASLATA